jgi:hypothetical protein
MLMFVTVIPLATTMSAFLLGKPVWQWLLIGLALASVNSLTLIMVYLFGREQMETNGYKW